MINTQNADKVLQTVYLDVVGKQINTTTSPFYNMIEKGAEGVIGKEFCTNSRLGISGGIGCSSDEAALPDSGTPLFFTFRAPLINVYGNVEITDKAMRAAAGNPTHAVDLLNTEMEHLIAAAKFNFDRMLFQNGNGELCKTVENEAAIQSTSTSTVFVDNTRNLVEGMLIDCIKNNVKVNTAPCRITYVDRVNKSIKVDGRIGDIGADNVLTLQGAWKNELYGLEYLFAPASEITGLYGNLRNMNANLLPTSYSIEEVDGDAMQQIIDDVEERGASGINLIIASYAMRRKYLTELRENALNVDYLYLDGGFRSLAYNGIPVYADRFVKEEDMYFVNTDDFKLGQLTDWTWIEGGNGRILRRMENKAAYAATLVKYANLICKRPVGQAKAYYEEQH